MRARLPRARATQRAADRRDFFVEVNADGTVASVGDRDPERGSADAGQGLAGLVEVDALSFKRLERCQFRLDPFDAQQVLQIDGHDQVCILLCELLCDPQIRREASTTSRSCTLPSLLRQDWLQVFVWMRSALLGLPTAGERSRQYFLE